MSVQSKNVKTADTCYAYDLRINRLIRVKAQLLSVVCSRWVMIRVVQGE